jgi:hypothetical protein
VPLSYCIPDEFVKIHCTCHEMWVNVTEFSANNHVNKIIIVGSVLLK